MCWSSETLHYVLDVGKVEFFLPVTGSHLCLEEILNPEVNKENHDDGGDHTNFRFNHHHEPFLLPRRLKVGLELGQIKTQQKMAMGYYLFSSFLFIYPMVYLRLSFLLSPANNKTLRKQ